MSAKRRDKAGESIAETLISVLIVALTFSFLTGAVVSSSKVNAKLKGQDVTFRSNGNEELTDYTITVSDGGADTIPELKKGENTLATDPDGTEHHVDVHLYRTENGYYYYEIEPTAP